MDHNIFQFIFSLALPMKTTEDRKRGKVKFLVLFEGPNSGNISSIATSKVQWILCCRTRKDNLYFVVRLTEKKERK